LRLLVTSSVAPFASSVPPEPAMLKKLTVAVPLVASMMAPDATVRAPAAKESPDCRSTMPAVSLVLLLTLSVSLALTSSVALALLIVRLLIVSAARSSVTV